MLVLVTVVVFMTVVMVVMFMAIMLMFFVLMFMLVVVLMAMIVSTFVPVMAVLAIIGLGVDMFFAHMLQFLLLQRYNTPAATWLQTKRLAAKLLIIRVLHNNPRSKNKRGLYNNSLSIKHLTASQNTGAHLRQNGNRRWQITK